MKLFNSMTFLVKENGLLFGIYIILSKSKFRTQSKLMEIITGWKNIKLEGQFQINGIRNMVIGENFYAKHGLWMETITKYQGYKYKARLVIGKNFSCSAHVHLSCAETIIIGDNVLLGSNVLIADNFHGNYTGEITSNPFEPPVKRVLGGLRRVCIEDNVWLCDDVKILPGSHIGAGAIISTGSVVKGNIPAGCIADGKPARPIKIYDQKSGQWKKINESKNK